MINLLQIVDSLSTASKADINQDGSISLGELLTMGGWIMIPLMFLLVVSINVFF